MDDRLVGAKVVAGRLTDVREVKIEWCLLVAGLSRIGLEKGRCCRFGPGCKSVDGLFKPRCLLDARLSKYEFPRELAKRLRIEDNSVPCQVAVEICSIRLHRAWQPAWCRAFSSDAINHAPRNPSASFERAFLFTAGKWTFLSASRPRVFFEFAPKDGFSGGIPARRIDARLTRSFRNTCHCSALPTIVPRSIRSGKSMSKGPEAREIDISKGKFSARCWARWLGARAELGRLADRYKMVENRIKIIKIYMHAMTGFFIEFTV